jgi:putative flippase GtrA
VTRPATERLALHHQLVRFVAAGVISAVVDFSILWVLMHFGLGHTPAKAISFVAGTTTAYLINRRWTFGAAGSTKTFIGVLVLYGSTFVVQVGLFSLLYPWLDSRWGYTFAQVVGFVIAQGVATTVNFIVQRTVIFRH